MNCWCCGSEMVWGNDFSYEDYMLDGDGIVSEFSCSNPECNCHATFYNPFEEDNEDVIL